jgi:hypothetical protein
MKKIIVLFAISLFTLTSCIVKKNYINRVVKDGNLESSSNKTVLITGVENIQLNNFVNTYEKNFPTDSLFVDSYVNEFITLADNENLFAEYIIDIHPSWEELNKGINADKTLLDELFTYSEADYIINFSNFEITNRVETTYNPGIGTNGVGTHSSVEYCIVNAEVMLFDVKEQKRILEFVTTGESSVFLFDFTKTFLKAKTRSIEHIVNYLKSGKTTYVKN